MEYTFKCQDCFDTLVIDRHGAEIECPYCTPKIVIKLSGLNGSLASAAEELTTARLVTASTAYLHGTPREIRNDARTLRANAVTEATRKGLKGRNWVSSGPIALEKRVRKAVRDMGY